MCVDARIVARTGQYCEHATPTSPATSFPVDVPIGSDMSGSDDCGCSCDSDSDIDLDDECGSGDEYSSSDESDSVYHPDAQRPVTAHGHFTRSHAPSTHAVASQSGQPPPVLLSDSELDGTRGTTELTTETLPDLTRLPPVPPVAEALDAAMQTNETRSFLE